MAGDWDVVSHDDFTPQASPQTAPQGTPQAAVQPAGAASTPPSGGDWDPIATHAVSGPSGSFWTDAKNRLGTAAIDALTGLISPIIGHTDEIGKIQSKLTGVPMQPAPQTVPEARDAAFQTSGITEYQPQTLGGRIGQAALTGAMGGLVSPSTIPAMAAGSATSELAGELFPDHPLIARTLGFLPGALAANGVMNAPLPAAGGGLDRETAQLAKTATSDYKIPLSAGQISGNPFVRYFYSETGKLPFSGAEKFGESQQGAFNKAVASTIGEDAEKITPEVLQSAKNRIGGVFNDVAARTSIPVNDDFLSSLQNVVDNSKLSVSADSIPAIEKSTMNILNTAANNGGNIGGRAYIDLTAKGGPIDSMLQSGDSGIRQAGQQLRSILDDSLQKSAAPQDLDALQSARSQWKAMRTVEPLTLRADSVNGATPSTGDISPGALRNAVNKSYNNAAFAKLGDIPLNDLAKIGQRFLKEPPDSGSPTRIAANHAAGLMGGVAAMMAGHEMASALGLHGAVPLATGAGTIMASKIARAILDTPYLANRAVQGSLNPEGFRFTQPSVPQALPVLSAPTLPVPWGPATSTSSPQRLP